MSAATEEHLHIVDHKVDEGPKEKDDRQLFTSVMESIRLDILAEYASAVRRKLDRNGADQKLDSFEPVTIGSPLFGSYHVHFPVGFSDGIRWLLMVPANGIRDRFDKTPPKDVVRACRIQALKEVAAAMVQLDKFSFDQGGSTSFDEHGQPARVGPVRFVDNQAMLERLRTDDPDEFAIYVGLAQ